MSCKCKDCGKSTKEGEYNYMYREKEGVSVFTGFIQKNGDYEQIYWVGKDEKTPPQHINTKNPGDIGFFMKEMRQYD